MSVVVAPAPLSGRRVRIDGLQGRPEFNGRSGVARRFDAAKGRYEVAVEGANFKMLLKPANLQLQDEADTDDATMTAAIEHRLLKRRFASWWVVHPCCMHPVCVCVLWPVAATGI